MNGPAAGRATKRTTRRSAGSAPAAWGAALAARLLRAGEDVMAYIRTRSKTEPLVAEGAKAVDAPADLGTRDIVFVTVASSDDLLAVLVGECRLPTGGSVPRIVVGTVSEEASASARARWAERGAESLVYQLIQAGVDHGFGDGDG